MLTTFVSPRSVRTKSRESWSRESWSRGTEWLPSPSSILLFTTQGDDTTTATLKICVPILCVLRQGSTYDTNDMPFSPMICVWHQRIAYYANNMPVSPTICMLHQGFACYANNVHVTPTIYACYPWIKIAPFFLSLWLREFYRYKTRDDANTHQHAPLCAHIYQYTPLILLCATLISKSVVPTY